MYCKQTPLFVYSCLGFLFPIFKLIKKWYLGKIPNDQDSNDNEILEDSITNIAHLEY